MYGLEPLFYQMPNPRPLPEGFTFSVTAYSRYDRYTLVAWKLGKDEFITGEALYFDTQLIASGGGILPIYAPKPPVPVQSTPLVGTVFDAINTTVGGFGVPSAIAMQLRDPNNQVILV